MIRRALSDQSWNASAGLRHMRAPALTGCVDRYKSRPKVTAKAAEHDLVTQLASAELSVAEHAIAMESGLFKARCSQRDPATEPLPPGQS
jgi:hypothetical protein